MALIITQMPGECQDPAGEQLRYRCLPEELRCQGDTGGWTVIMLSIGGACPATQARGQDRAPPAPFSCPGVHRRLAGDQVIYRRGLPGHASRGGRAGGRRHHSVAQEGTGGWPVVRLSIAGVCPVTRAGGRALARSVI